MNKLAIIIPAYKPNYLAETLESLAVQTNKNFRVYVGDDASPHDIKKIVDEFHNTLDIRYHRFEENMGAFSLVKQWERCVELSDEQLFIDAVDIEYCFRLKKKYGLQTIVFPSVIMKHAIGYPIKTIFGFNASAYSAFRTYYLVRNQIYILRKYSNFYTFKEKFGIINNYILKRLFILIFYETDKFSKLKALIKGCKDGLLKLK